MSLTAAILRGNKKQILAMLEAGEEVNVIDIYGFTPLIEAAIANHTEIAEMLLEHHADVNKPDATGGSALHWAVNNNNIELVELLLKYNANPNAYTRYGQSVLVKPLLRKQKELLNILLHAGADLKFAQDYVNAKLLAHRYSLTGDLFLSTPDERFVPIDLEGFVIEFTVNVIWHSLKRFSNHYGARKLQDYSKKFDKVIKALHTASKLLGYQHYLIDYQQYSDEIDELLKQPALLLPIGYEGHAISWVYCNGFLAKCDRKQDSHQEESVVVYRIGQPDNWTPGLIKEILFTKQNKFTMEQGIFEYLGLEVAYKLPMAKQETGNCSWANVEAAIPTLLFLLQNKQLNGESESGLVWYDALSVFEQWQDWDRWQALQQCMEQFVLASSMARKTAKALLLSTILFQRCSHDKAEHARTIRKILSIFQHEEKLLPILQTYLNVYSEQFPTLAGHNFVEILEIYG